MECKPWNSYKLNRYPKMQKVNKQLQTLGTFTICKNISGLQQYFSKSVYHHFDQLPGSSKD